MRTLPAADISAASGTKVRFIFDIEYLVEELFLSFV